MNWLVNSDGVGYNSSPKEVTKMLQFLRKRENVKKIMWTLAILIIPAFVLWGSGSSVRSRGAPKYAGRIFGKKVSFGQFQEALLACRNQALLIYREDFNKVAQYLDLEQEAWERLILLEQAKKAKIKVSNKEVIDFIRSLPLFQIQGRFDQRRYNTLLDYAFRTSARGFEEQTRDMLKIVKLKGKVIGQVEVTEEEIEEAYKNENEKAKVLYVLIEPQNFKEQIHPAYEDLEKYYQNHKSEFEKPEQVNVEYIALYFDRASSEVEVTEEEIENFYQEHIDEFTSEDKKGQASIKPQEEVKAQIKERLLRDKVKIHLEDKIWQIADEIQGEPESFAEVAKGNQLEVKETGFFGPQQVIPDIGLSYEFLNASFSLKVNEVSNVIETPKGYLIIKVKEKRGPRIPPLDEIKKEVESACVQQKSWELAKSKADEILRQIKELIAEEKLDFPKAAEKLSLTVKETEEFSRFSYISGIGQSPEFAQAAFAIELGQVSELITVPNGYCILSPKELIPIDAEKFSQEKEEFVQGLLARKKELTFKIWLASLKKQANLESNLGRLNQ